MWPIHHTYSCAELFKMIFNWVGLRVQTMDPTFGIGLDRDVYNLSVHGIILLDTSFCKIINKRSKRKFQLKREENEHIRKVEVEPNHPIVPCKSTGGAVHLIQ